jgi:hypothetical protein
MSEHFAHEIAAALKRRTEDRLDTQPWHQRLVDTRDAPSVHQVTLTIGELRELIFAWRADIEFAEQMARWATDNAERAWRHGQSLAAVRVDCDHTKGRLYDRIEQLESELAAAREQVGSP